MLTIPIFLARSTTEIIETTFMITGAIAGTVNLLWLFKTLVTKPDMLMTTSEKIIILFMAAKLEISILLPEILESKTPMGDEKIKMRMEIIINTTIKILVTELTKSFISSLSPFLRQSAYIGIKAATIIDSAKRTLKRLGMKYAHVKASVS
jgi:hypothetical protein